MRKEWYLSCFRNALMAYQEQANLIDVTMQLFPHKTFFWGKHVMIIRITRSGRIEKTKFVFSPHEY